MASRRDENGPLQFHKGTEEKLLNFVVENAETGNPDSVIEEVDKFCWDNHWMMHVGDLKGAILDEVVEERKPKYILELGTYCGYSAIRMARFLPENGKLFTIEPNEYNRGIATQMIKKAGLEDKVEILAGLSSVLIPSLGKYVESFDLVFIDHAKNAYYPDLLLLEQHKLLKSGSCLVADNVIIFKINDYLDHVRNSGKYKTEIKKAYLEYTNSNNFEPDKEDGLEISTML